MRLIAAEGTAEFVLVETNLSLSCYDIQVDRAYFELVCKTSDVRSYR
jgi:hypothetical protein